MFNRFDRLTIHYPTFNRVNSVPEYSRRSLIVQHVRDLVADPLTPLEYLWRPLVHRGRFMVRALDTQTGRVRNYYLAGSLEYYRPSPMRLALYDPDSPRKRPLRILFEPFEPTPGSRILLARTIRRLMAYQWGQLELRVMADDLVCRRAG